MDMKLCGVDLLFGEKGYIVGEINSMPGCLLVMHQGKYPVRYSHYFSD